MIINMSGLTTTEGINSSHGSGGGRGRGGGNGPLVVVVELEEASHAARRK